MYNYLYNYDYDQLVDSTIDRFVPLPHRLDPRNTFIPSGAVQYFLATHFV